MDAKPVDEEGYAIVQDLVTRCGHILHGNDPGHAGAALAQLLAMLCAGHQGTGAEKAREELLELHMRCVRALIPIEEARLLQHMRASSH